MSSTFDPEAILARPLMAHLATIAGDGAPRNAPVWFQWEQDALWMLGGVGNASTGRLLSDARCAVEIVDYDNASGVLRHLGLRGRADILPMDAALYRRLLTRYLGPEPGWNRWFVERVARIDDPDGRLIRLRPESTFTNDVSYFRTGPDLASAPG